MAFIQKSVVTGLTKTVQYRQIDEIVRDIGNLSDHVTSEIAAITHDSNIGLSSLVITDAIRTLALSGDTSGEQFNLINNSLVTTAQFQGDGVAKISNGTQTLSIEPTALGSKIVLDTGTSSLLSNVGAGKVFDWTINTVRKMYLTSAGELGINRGVAPSAMLDVGADGALSTDIAFNVRNSADTADLFRIDGVGNVWANGKGSVQSNTIFGELALDGTDGGTNNCVFGYGAASSSNGLDDQVVIGRSAGALMSSAQKGVIIGSYAGGAVTTAFGCVFVGYRAGDAVQTTAGNTHVGNEAGQAVTGQQNQMFGARAGYSVTSGEYNLMLGQTAAGNGITTGDYNTIVGNQITGLAAGLSNNIIITDGQAKQGFKKDANGNIVLGAESALSTTDTDGFVYIPSVAGVPTGLPTAVTGKVPMQYDSTNHNLYIYSGGSWRIH